MQLKNFRLILPLACLVFLSLRCGQAPLTSEGDSDDQSVSALDELPKSDWKVRRAADWDQFFYREKGWFGADGIFCIPLDGVEHRYSEDEDRETLLIFSDTLIGKAEGDSTRRSDFMMVNNTVGMLKGSRPDTSKMMYYWREGDTGVPLSIFDVRVPEDAGKDEYYWMGDGFVNIDADSTIYVFAYRIKDLKKTAENNFGFAQTGTNIVAIPYGSEPPFEDHRQIETPLFYPNPNGEGDVTWGSGIFVNTESAGAPEPDGYIYIYAMEGIEKGLLVARVQPQAFDDISAWKYWTGESWSDDMMEAKPVATRTSNEMSVTVTQDGRYMLTYQYATILPGIAIQVGESPYGPFGPAKEVYETPENEEDDDYFSYNAKAHPHLSPPGELLISYNVNSTDFWNDVFWDAHLYRPRFIRVEIP